MAIYEANGECAWIRFMIKHIQKSCELSFIKYTSTVFYEDNVVLITQIKGEYITDDEPRIFHQGSFVHTSFKRVVKSMFSK